MATSIEHFELVHLLETPWARQRWVCRLRSVLQVALLIPVARWFCRPFSILGRDRLPHGPAIYVANHGSHADTPAIIAALPKGARSRLAPAAAQDYFFSSSLKGRAVELLTGAFPFPRRGDEGLRRARRLLDAGWSVLLFPEGTRSRDGAIAPFRGGAGKLAALGYPVVPVALAGTRDVLPAGRTIPRQAPVAVVFGEPVRYGFSQQPVEIARDLERRARALAANASTTMKPARRTWRARIRSLAFSRTGPALAFFWGVAEAIAWPVVPDFAVALMALAAPARFPLLAFAAVAGSVAGGAIAYILGAVFGSGVLEHLPLVTERMTAQVQGWLSLEGARGVAHQTWSGVPFKVFGWQAAEQGIGFAGFVSQTVLARAPRIFASGLGFAVVGTALHRWMDRLYGALALVFVTVFAIGLARVLALWS